MKRCSAFLKTCNYVKFSRCVLIWPPIPARKPKSKSPGSASTVNGGAANKKTRAQRVVLFRTTLTGADEPYNGQAVRATITSFILLCSTSELLITSTFA